jgi:hypothetical protein
MPSLKDYLYLGVLVAVLAAFGLYTHHEREVGRQAVERADTEAKALLATRTRDYEERLQQAANLAAQERQSAQATLNDYMVAHPLRTIRLCYANDSGGGLSKASESGAGAPGPGPSSASLPAVPGRDISGDFDTIVQSAARLALLYRERQALDAHP